MALCHIHIKTGTRKSGQSAGAKYDYISRGGAYERALGSDLVHLESGNMPSFAEADPRAYWAAADAHERANGRLFRSMTAALPNELNDDEQIQLARSFAESVAGGDMPYTLAIHAGKSTEDGQDNPHLHLVFSERVNDGIDRSADMWFRRAAAAKHDPASGGAKKTARTQPKEWLHTTRADWATMATAALADIGSTDRVDHRRLSVQRFEAQMAGDFDAAAALDRPPQRHRGCFATPPSRAAARGAKTASASRDVAAASAEIATLTDQLDAACVEAVPAEMWQQAEATDEPMLVPAAPPVSLAALRAEQAERQRVAAVPAPTWAEVAATDVPMHVPGDGITLVALEDERIERQRVAAVPVGRWIEAAATELPMRVPPDPGVSRQDLEAEIERRDREHRREAAAAAERAAAERATAAAADREREERAAATRIRNKFDEATLFDTEPVRAAGRRIEQEHRGVDWAAVGTSLQSRQARDVGRYQETQDLGHGEQLLVGSGREAVETDALKAAEEQAAPRRRPRTTAEAVLAAVEAIQRAADVLIDALLERIAPGLKRPAPAPEPPPAAAPAATTAPPPAAPAPVEETPPTIAPAPPTAAPATPTDDREPEERPSDRYEDTSPRRGRPGPELDTPE